MSRRGRKGKQQWIADGPDFANQLHAEIEATTADRERRWHERGHYPWWLRAKRRLQRRRPNGRNSQRLP